MIEGTGNDLTELARVKRALEKQPTFLERVLAPEERAQAAAFHSQRLVEYVGGRWSLKESFAKAMGTGIGPEVGFQDLAIVDNDRGKPEVLRSPYPGKVHVAISHTKELVMTNVTLERMAKND